MNFNFQDPAFLIPLGIILLCIGLLIWALKKLFKTDAPPADLPFSDELFTPPAANEIFRPAAVVEPNPPVEVREIPTRNSANSNRDMADRLEGMTQKLSDMQTVLQKQTASASAGTPLPAETIDKLLKIIGNVTQQVDILQKSLGSAPVLSTPAAHAPAASTPLPATPPATPIPKVNISPTPTPAPSVGGKSSIGVVGGALSGFGKSASPQKPGGVSSTPPTSSTTPPSSAK